MIKAENRTFQLHTLHTSYVFRITQAGYPEHLYYGKALGALRASDIAAMTEKFPCQTGNVILSDADDKTFAPENACLEFSAYGKGDLREPFVELIYPDGFTTCDFRYDAARILPDKAPYETLPGSYGMPENEHLCVAFRDHTGLLLELHYYVYPQADVICRSTRLINRGTSPVRIRRLMSAMLDFHGTGFVMTTFGGAWAREMTRTDTPVRAGTHSVSSVCGVSSNRANPFFMVSRPSAAEEAGECWALNLIYSGNHYEAVQAGAFGKTRIISGINPAGFDWLLSPGESFEAPEAILTFSDGGYRGVSLNMQRFIRSHIVRGFWKDRERPVLLNSWEASYFHFNETGIRKLAKTAKKAGMELFVLDDGWFGRRNDDTSSLGDWTASRKKLPHGLDGLSQYIHALGMNFGIWVEPEMVSVDSDFYRAHPDWVLEHTGTPHAEGRNQRMLDLANPEVVSCLTQILCSLLSSARIEYVKWDCNRFFSDVFSPSLPAERQGETAHRYMTGLYRLLKNVTEAFPEILFEGCAAGGGRFDPGMLCYFPQIWASDNTDPICRAQIQEGYSCGYPMSCIGAHVSASPNHQTLRRSPPETRFGVAAFGVLGYECNLCDLSRNELAVVREQVTLYKKWRRVLQYGDFYRLSGGNEHRWICVSPDRTMAVGLLLQEQVQANTQYHDFRAAGLEENLRYHFYSLPHDYDIRDFGSLADAVSPVHIRQGSRLQEAAARAVRMPGETEEELVSGTVLMHCGIRLKGAFTATGYSSDVRLFRDYDSRLYFMEAADPDEDLSGTAEAAPPGCN